MGRPLDLDPLFGPNSVGFIGASEDSPFFKNIYSNITEYGPDRDLFFINPNRESVFKHDCHDSIKDVPDEVDLAIITTPVSVVPAVFKECCQANVGSVIVVSAGFGEAGETGEKYQRQLTELSEEYDVPFCGPNTFGLLSVYDEIVPAQVSTLDFNRGNLSIVTQSGGLMNQILYSANERGYGFSYVVDSGNEAGIVAADYIEYFLKDENTDVIAGVIEGFSKPEKFVEIARKAVKAGKPVIVLKLARSERGGEIAQSHTGSMTTSDDIVTSLLKQYGVVQADSLDMYIELSELFSKVQEVAGGNMAVIEISGGGCTLFSDAASETEHLTLPSLTSETNDRIEENLPPLGSAHNPVDLGVGWGADGMDETHTEILDALADQEDIDLLVSRLSIPQTGPVDTAAARYSELEEITSETDVQSFAVSRASGQVSDQWRSRIRNSDVPFLQEYHKGTKAIDRIAWYSDVVESADRRFREQADGDRLDIESGIVNEYRAKQMLSDQGLPTVREELASSAEQAVSIADDIRYPVCLKVVSDDILHKSDIEGVKINVATPEEVREAYTDIERAVSNHSPDASIDGILVQEMVSEGVEMLLGSTETPFGQMIVIGLGGIFTEVMDDTSMRLAPVTTLEAEEMTQELQAYDVLRGVRGEQTPDVESLVELIKQFSEIVAINDQLAEIDLNPVIVDEDGAHIVDALFVSES